MKTDFVWWQGKVEDVNDPLELGRCRVRILGFHTDNKVEIPTNTLPWAYPANPINSRPGETSLGPVDGSWVLGFFRDGNDAQEPVMTHSIDLGFKTSDDSEPSNVDVGEVNAHRLSRGNTSGSYVASTTLPFSDKTSLAYDAKFPYNQVVESLSGHITEVDDTPGAERLATHHKSGTLEVIEEDGTKIVKVVGDNYEVVVGDNNVHITGTTNVTISGSANINIGNNITDSVTITSTGNLNLESTQGFITMKSLMGVSVQAPFLGNSIGALMQPGSPFVAPVPTPMVDLIRAADDAAALADMASSATASVDSGKVTALEIKS